MSGSQGGICRQNARPSARPRRAIKTPFDGVAACNRPATVEACRVNSAATGRHRSGMERKQKLAGGADATQRYE